MNTTTELGIVLAGCIFQKEAGELAAEHKDELEKRYSKSFVKEMMALASCSDEEARLAVKAKAKKCCIYELKNTGLFPALWDVAEEYKKGLEIDVRAIKIRQESVEVCEFLDLNPYELPSSSSLLIVTEAPLEILMELEQRGVPSSIIGRLTSSKARILRNGERVRYLDKNRGPKATE